MSLIVAPTRPPDRAPFVGSPRIRWESPLSRGLIHAWPLTDGPTGEARDIAGGIHLAADPSRVPAVGTDPRMGLASRFTSATGENHSAAVNPAVLSGASGGTVSVWFRFDSTPASQGYYLIQGRYTRPFLISLYGSILQGKWRVAGGSQKTASQTPSGPLTEWRHVVSTFDSSYGAVLYCDGEQIAENTDTPDVLYTYTSETMMVGDPSAGFDGRLAHAFIWNRALDSREVAELYRSPFGLYDVPDLPVLLEPVASASIFPVIWHMRRRR